MAWTPKSSAPATFSLTQAFLALITGDATWGWLADWIQLVPPTAYNTAAFCAQGPLISAPLTVTDFIPTFNPLDPRQAIHTAALGTLLAAAARDRVFGAYCETAVSGSGGWDPQQIFTIDNTAGPDAYSAICDLPSYSAGRFRLQEISYSGSDQTHTLVSFGGTAGSVNVWTFGFPVDIGGYTDKQSPGTNFRLQAQFLFGHPAACTYGIEPYNPSGAGLGTPYNPTAQVQPTGVVSPLLTVDPSLAGIAAELARHEFKLDFLTSLVQSVAGATLDLGAPTSDPADLAPNTPVDVLDAVGCVLVASGIPASRSLDFGTPQNIVRLGHINLGTASAWYPSIWLTHSPMVIRPFPPGVTRLTVTDLPPGCTVTIALIPRAK
jgi:hypothetical protein